MKHVIVELPHPLRHRSSSAEMLGASLKIDQRGRIDEIAGRLGAPWTSETVWQAWERLVACDLVGDRAPRGPEGGASRFKYVPPLTFQLNVLDPSKVLAPFGRALAVVMGRDCCEVPAEQAYDYVFGYTIMNDLSCRDVQFAERKEGNICIGKNFPTAAPLGPWIVTKDEIPDPHNLRIVTRVNGEVRQDSNTKNQIYNIPAQIAWYSHAGFEPGDLISTGTPAGTGFLHPAVVAPRHPAPPGLGCSP